MKKAALRKIYLSKRNALSPLLKDKLEDLMLIQFQKLDIMVPTDIMTYAAFGSEYSPHLVESFCRFRNPGLQLYYPVVDKELQSLHPVPVNENSIFEKSSFGVPEPVGEAADPEQLGLMIVPLLAFDRKGYRVGYGKGYYDRFLKVCSKGALKIGFSFFEAEHDIEDIDAHDVKLDLCITPEKIYEF